MALIRATSGSGGGGTPTVINRNVYSTPISNLACQNAVYVCGSADGQEITDWGYVSEGALTKTKTGTRFPVSYTDGKLSISSNNTYYNNAFIMYS